jgi:uncharacterized protein (DUF697 family)
MTDFQKQLPDLVRFLSGKGFKKLDRANEIVNNHVLWSMGGGLVPIPVLDVAAVTAVQLNMINELCKVYGIEYTESAGKSWIAALSGSTLARVGASVLKALVPGGLVLGMVTMSVLSGASTFAIGQVFISHFEANGTLENLNLEVMRRIYEEQLERGKELATRLQKDPNSVFQGGVAQAAPGPVAPVPPPPAATTDQLFAKLEKLADLRSKGILTDEEFNAKKAQLLSQL